jgi:glycosyltransferase involved in cell wall biosynthesis
LTGNPPACLCYNRTVLIGVDASRAAKAQRTGTETYSLRLIRALIGLRSGCSFRLYTNGPPPPGLFAEPRGAGGADSRDPQSSALGGDGRGDSRDVEVRSIPFPRLWTHLRLSLEMVVRPPDVLFVPAHVLPLFHPRRSVATVHDLGFRYYPEAHRPADRRYLAWATAWNARRSTAVLADSQATRSDLVWEYGVSESKVHVVYLGRDESLIPVTDPEALEKTRVRYGLGKRYLLYVGTLQPRKNLGRMVEAFARLASAPLMVDVQLVLAGRRGWLYEDLFSQVRRQGLQERILFPGYVDEADLAALYSGALGYVFPSLYEGFGMPVLEAQACGVPVMTSNNSSLPEVAGDAALLVDPTDVDAIADAILRLATDEALRARLVERGFENVKRFSWEKCARETLEVLESVGKKK